MLLVVALATQVVWVLARYAGEEMFGRSSYLVGLEFGASLASMLVAALALFDLATRLSVPKKLGPMIAAGAFAVYAGCMIVVEIAWRVGWDDWIVWMHVYGWRALDVIAIVGLAISGGDRALWVAVPAIGLAVIGHASGLAGHDAQPWLALISGLRFVLLCMLMQKVERFATHETSYHRLARGFRILELGLWISGGVRLCYLIPAISLPTSPAVAFATNVSSIALFLVSATGTWLILRSRMAGVPRWPFAVGLVTMLWQTARTARSWTITLATKWDRFETVKLTYVPWWVGIPSTIGALCLGGALFVLARRLQLSARVSVVAIVISVAKLALAATGIAPHWITILVGATADLALVLALRAIRANIHLVHERAMHAHTFA